MTDQEINIAVATACGWTRSEPHDYDAWADYPAGMDCRQRFWTKDGVLTEQRKLPDYANDLNAIHAAVQSLGEIDQIGWAGFLYEVARSNHPDKDVAMAQATAKQRAVAFLEIIHP